MSLLKVKPFSLDQTATFSFANANIAGNIVSGNANLGNLASANYFSGNASLLFGIAAGNITGQVANSLVAGTVYTAAQPNITSVGTLTSVTVSGASDLGAVANVKITGGSTGYVLKTDGQGNLSWGSMTTGTGNANVAGSNTQIQFNDGTNLSASGNLTFDVSTKTLAVDFISANGSALFGLAGGNVVGDVSGANHANVADSANAVAGANVSGAVAFATTANAVAGANVSGAVANATYAVTAGTANSVAGANVSGEVAFAAVANSVAGANVSGAVAFATTANAVAGANVSGTVANATYAVTAGTANSVAGANVTGTVANATYATTAGSADSVAGANVTGQVGNALVAGTVYTNAQPNITSVGTLTSLAVTGSLSAGDATITGNLTVTGTTTTVNSTVTRIVDPIFELGGGANGAALSSNDGKERGQLLHYYDGGVKDAFMGWMNTDKVFTFASSVSVTDNTVTITTLGNIKAGDANLGNAVTSNYFIGNGSLLTGVVATTAVSVTASAQPNITSVGTLTSLSVTGNLSAGNVAGGNLVSANYVSGNGSLLSALAGANVTGQVGNALVSGTVYTAAQPNITSVGTLTTLAVSGTTNLGAVGNITITGGNANYVLKTDGTGNLAWTAMPTTEMVVDTFTGDGTWTMKTLSATPASVDYTIVGIGGVLQPRDAYSVLADVITFDEAPPAGYVVEITTVTGGGSSGGSGGGSSYTYSEVTSNVTMTASTKYIVDTSTANITLTLPSTGTLGDEISIIDGTGNASTHAITIARNGGKIQGAASDMTVTTDRAAFTLAYYNATQGWLLTNV
jgi:hypothetical protein